MLSQSLTTTCNKALKCRSLTYGDLRRTVSSLDAGCCRPHYSHQRLKAKGQMLARMEVRRKKIDTSSTPCASKPGSVDAARWSARMNKPAAMTMTTLNATCPITKACRRLRRPTCRASCLGSDDIRFRRFSRWRQSGEQSRDQREYRRNCDHTALRPPQVQPHANHRTTRIDEE
jgi:hypothetical protein